MLVTVNNNNGYKMQICLNHTIGNENVDIVLNVTEFDYQPAEKMTREYPGCEASAQPTGGHATLDWGTVAPDEKDMVEDFQLLLSLPHVFQEVCENNVFQIEEEILEYVYKQQKHDAEFEAEKFEIKNY